MKPFCSCQPEPAEMEDSLQILYNCIYFLFLQAVLSSVHDLTKLWKSRILNSSKCTFQEALMQLSTPVILYLLLINFFAFALMGIDKEKARRHKPCFSLLFWAAASAPSPVCSSSVIKRSTGILQSECRLSWFCRRQDIFS